MFSPACCRQDNGRTRACSSQMVDYAKWDKLESEVKREEEKEKAEKPPERIPQYVEKLRQGQTQLGDKKLDMTPEVR